MALVSMYILLFLVIAIILCVIFLIGTVLLIIGLAKKKKADSPVKTAKKGLIISGGIMMAVPTVITLVLIISVIGKMFGLPLGNNTLPERWQHSWVNDSQAANQAITELLSSSDKSDKEKFASCFTKELRDDPYFQDYVDAYFSSYPTGLSECELDGGSNGSSGSYNYGHNVQTGYASYTCQMNGDHYFITLDFCYENTDEPDKVGVTVFTVRNLESRAVYNKWHDETDNDPYLLCSIVSSDQVNARLIAGDAYEWTETDSRKLTVDEMKDLLDKVESINDDLFIETAGLPNAEDIPGSEDYYYELEPENGEPRYAYIVTSRYRIIYGYLCTPYETDYSCMLCDHKITD